MQRQTDSVVGDECATESVATDNFTEGIQSNTAENESMADAEKGADKAEESPAPTHSLTLASSGESFSETSSAHETRAEEPTGW